jgi:hypothetical protein
MRKELMNKRHISPAAMLVIIAVVLLTSTVAITLAAARLSHERLIATTTNCHPGDTTTWIVRGQIIICDLRSEDPRFAGRITFYQHCPPNETVGCNGTFEVEAKSGLRCEGSYDPASLDGTLARSAEGRCVGDSLDARVALDIYSLDSNMPDDENAFGQIFSLY